MLTKLLNFVGSNWERLHFLLFAIRAFRSKIMIIITIYYVWWCTPKTIVTYHKIFLSWLSCLFLGSYLGFNYCCDIYYSTPLYCPLWLFSNHQFCQINHEALIFFRYNIYKYIKSCWSKFIHLSIGCSSILQIFY
jgi:hypothetical protein